MTDIPRTDTVIPAEPQPFHAWDEIRARFGYQIVPAWDSVGPGARLAFRAMWEMSRAPSPALETGDQSNLQKMQSAPATSGFCQPIPGTSVRAAFIDGCKSARCSAVSAEDLWEKSDTLATIRANAAARRPSPDHIANAGKVIEPDPDLTTYLKNIAGWLDYRNLGATADKIREVAARIRTLDEAADMIAEEREAWKARALTAESLLAEVREIEQRGSGNLCACRDALAEAESLLERAREALKPFAGMIDKFPDHWPDNGGLLVYLDAGDVRAAARLARGGGGE